MGQNDEKTQIFDQSMVIFRKTIEYRHSYNVGLMGNQNTGFRLVFFSVLTIVNMLRRLERMKIDRNCLRHTDSVMSAGIGDVKILHEFSELLARKAVK